MIAYMYLQYDMDTIMALSASYSLLELPVRFTILATSKGSAFELADWPIYLSIVVASVFGFQLGIYLRRRLDSAAVLRMLLVLIFLSSGILLGMLTSAVAAAMMTLFALILTVLVILAYWRPAILYRFVRPSFILALFKRMAVLMQRGRVDVRTPQNIS
jgi:hypothetical protein